MRVLAYLSVLAAASLGVAACAPVETADNGAPREARQCFEPSTIQNFTSDGQTLYVRAANRDVYELQTAGPCDNLRSTTGIAISPIGGVGRPCVGDWVDVGIAGSSSIGAPCRARVVRAMTRDEATALPDRLRP